MRIATRKGQNGHKIVRGERAADAYGWAYELMAPNTPTISIYLDGQDGVRYSLQLTDGDVRAINAARERYKEHFERKL